MTKINKDKRKAIIKFSMAQCRKKETENWTKQHLAEVVADYVKEVLKDAD